MSILSLNFVNSSIFCFGPFVITGTNSSRIILDKYIFSEHQNLHKLIACPSFLVIMYYCLIVIPCPGIKDSLFPFKLHLVIEHIYDGFCQCAFLLDLFHWLAELNLLIGRGIAHGDGGAENVNTWDVLICYVGWRGDADISFFCFLYILLFGYLINKMIGDLLFEISMTWIWFSKWHLYELYTNLFYFALH